jgi:cytochrome c biogenesis protein
MKKLLNFFTSIRVAITLLIILILASIMGTLIPQGRGAEEYLVRYGRLAGLFDRLQLTSLYRSIWYLVLLALFSLNITICTLTRLGPKLRKIFRSRFETDPKNLLALKIKDKLKLGSPLAAAGESARRQLARRHFRLKEEKAEGRIYLTGRKRVLGLFGSDIVHLGILVILAGGIISGLAGFRKDLTFIESQTLPVPGANFSLRLDKFITEYYPNGSVKDWKSDLSVIEGSRPLYQKTIEVNHPLNHRGYLFYQSGYGWDWQNPSLEVSAKKKANPADIKKLWLRVGEKVTLDQGGPEISVVRFLPDFVLDERNQPATRSLEPNNPAAYIEGRSGDAVVFSGWVFAKFPDFTKLHSAEETDLSFELKDVKAPQYSLIQMARDPGASLIWVGCALLMAGLFLAFYWPTREIRLILEDSQGKTDIAAGGISAKSREAFETEFAGIINNLRKQK